MGLRDKDIEDAKQSAEGLFKFLMNRLQGFQATSRYYAETLAGLWDNTQEAITYTFAQGFANISEYMKKELQSVQEMLFDLKFDDKGNITEALIKPEIIEFLKQVAQYLIAVYDVTKRVVMDLMPVWKLLGAVIEGVIQAYVMIMNVIDATLDGWRILADWLGKTSTATVNLGSAIGTGLVIAIASFMIVFHPVLAAVIGLGVALLS